MKKLKKFSLFFILSTMISGYKPLYNDNMDQDIKLLFKI